MRLIKPTYSFLVLLFVFCCWNYAAAQQNKELSIQNIEFEGLKKNKRSFLNRIIESEAGMAFDSFDIKKDLKYLSQLSGIAAVDFRLDTTENGIDLIFSIVEAKTFFPIINFGGNQG